MNTFSVKGNIVEIISRRFFFGEIIVEGRRIKKVNKLDEKADNSFPYILPGFIDSHVHIESSMLVPSEFAKLAVAHGTVATISDPHEIANVCGMKGVEYMITNGKTVPFKFNFGAPSCVPATSFETAGAVLNAADVDDLLKKDEILYLSEMMNFPGVLLNDKEVMNKIASAKKYCKPVDGHAPGLRGEEAKKYIEAGISTDHECFTAAEALDKLKFGMKILIREGSAAKNFEALIDLLHDYPEEIMFCSDDKHPDSLVDGHINLLCKRAVQKGIDIFNILRAACVNPVLHYKMNVGLLQDGDPADFIIVEDLVEFKTLKTFIDGKLVAENGISLIETKKADIINNFECTEKQIADFSFPITDWNNEVLAIEALEGQLITNRIICQPIIKDNFYEADITKDILKMVVINRYNNAPVAKSFVKNFGLKKGAFASTVAHDSHNIIAVGIDDDSLYRAVNLVIKEKGGVSAVCEGKEKVLGLPVAGLMSNENGYEVAKAYTDIDRMVKEDCGSVLAAPFMTLSFMALLVIPHLKLSDLGLFDGDAFKLLQQAI